MQTRLEAQADAELVALARSGDKAAFGQLIERHQATAGRIALRMVRDEDLAGELVQESILQAYLSLDHLRDNARFKSWLFGIVLNVCRSYLRDRRVVFFSLEAMAGGLAFDAIPLTSRDADPDQAAEERDLQRRIWDAVDALSPKNREATLLFYFDELSLSEIAAILGVSPGAVKGRLHKARKQLQESLLPDYRATARPLSTQVRRRIMVKVTIADVIKQERKDEHQNVFQHYVVILLDETGRQILPIWVGPAEGQAIATGVRSFATSRPLTYSFIARLLEAMGAALEEVQIQTLKEDVFYAVARLRRGEETREIDARPSDAIALAIRTGSPIYVAEDVLERGGVALPVETEKMTRLGQGMADILKDLESQQQAMVFKSTKEQLDKAHQELLDRLLGGAA